VGQYVRRRLSVGPAPVPAPPFRSINSYTHKHTHPSAHGRWSGAGRLRLRLLPQRGLQAHSYADALSVERGRESRRNPCVIFGSNQQSLAKCKMAFLAQHKDLVKNQ
jgi:hypothetical protein